MSSDGITVEQMKAKKNQLDERLRDIVHGELQKFREDTGVSIRSVYVHTDRSSPLGDDKSRYVCSVVNTEVDLGQDLYLS